MAKSRESQAHENKGRPARIPMAGGNKLHVPDALKEEDYHYYWAIDRKGMIEQLEAAWYEKVKDERGEDFTVAAGGGENHYLMRIKLEYYHEDMARQQEQNINTSTKEARQLGDNEYVPMGQKSVVERDII